MKKAITALILTAAVYAYTDDSLNHKYMLDAGGKKQAGIQKKTDEKNAAVCGNQMICPVTGEAFSVNEKTSFIEYAGKKYYFCCPACKDEFQKEPGKYASKTDIKAGNKFICPVMGTKFAPSSKSPKLEYKGKTYFFCCRECVEKFNKNPEKYSAAAKKTDRNPAEYDNKDSNAENNLKMTR